MGMRFRDKMKENAIKYVGHQNRKQSNKGRKVIGVIHKQYTYQSHYPDSITYMSSTSS